MKQVRKLISYSILMLIAIILLFMGGTWAYLVHQLPDMDATMATALITKKVSIIRDKWGVPHIKAANGNDAYFALGFTTAQDRLFQMELQRRLAKGELAQILGPKLTNVDKMFRTLLLKERAANYLAREQEINPEALQYLDSFLRGINQFIEKSPLPVEYTLLGFKPAPFTRLDTISMMGYVAYSFADGIKRDSLYTMLAPYLTQDDLKMVFPDYALENNVSIMEPTGNLPPSPLQAQTASTGIDKNSYAGLATPLENILEQVAKIVPPFTGSNSWVLAPSRSQNGHALLANDPHIGIANPGVWYEAHVQYPGYENYGYHLPLMPFPMLAHNGTKAWAITMFENDDLDLYGETFHPENPNLVKFEGEWTPIETITETIKVKGEPDEILTIRITSHGPVISDFIKGYTGTPVALSWVYHKVDSPILDVVFEMGKAKNLADFRQAVSKLAAPGLNISYIDAKGNIAWWAAGRLPIRPAHVSGKQIHDGSSGKDEFLGYLPFESNPHLVNPDNGLIITANNISTFTPIDRIGVITGYFRPSDRAARIYELLSQKEKWTLEELKEIQTDAKIFAGLPITKTISSILEEKQAGFTISEQTALAALKDWDGFMTTKTTGGTVFQFTVYHILKQALEPHIGPDNLKTYLNLVDHWDFLKRLLGSSAPPIMGTTPDLTPKSRDTIVLTGFKNAVTDITTTLGTQEKDWAWGSVHTIEYVHAIGRKKPLNLLFNVGPFPSPAEFTAINKLKSKTGNHDYKVSSLPSTRRLIDCNDLEASWSILPTGNSGNFMGSFYDDQAKMFIQNQYRPIIFTTELIEKNAAHVLTLVPE